MSSAADLTRMIANEMGMLPEHLIPIIRTSPLRYKVFYIPKKAGGVREVAQPAREVKAIQRWLMRSLETQLPQHAAATAYSLGSSIKENARRHVESNFLLKLDFKNFFPSILADDIEQHLANHCSDTLDKSARRLIARVCTWAPYRKPPLRLCIGAPSSPMLSNSIMYSFDVRLSELALRENVVYTRYADDLTLSSHRPETLEKFPGKVSTLLQELDYPKLTLNTGKTVFASRAGRRTVTGITLTSDHRLSIGRDRKREIRAMFHRSQLGLLTPLELERLHGLLAFADDIEPGFYTRLLKISGRGS